MKLPFPVVAAAVLVALRCGPTAARADYLYVFDALNPTVYSDQSGMSINLSEGDRAGPLSGSTAGIVATTLTTLINEGVTGTETFSPTQVAGIRATIIDGPERGSVEFPFVFSGLLSADHADLVLTFLEETTRTLVVNGQTYTVSLTDPATIPGSILARIDVGVPLPGDGNGSPDNGGNPAEPEAAPEPSGIVLAGIALTLLALARRSRCLTGLSSCVGPGPGDVWK